RTERDTRDELMRSLLSKSQTFHNRQKVGDITARVIGDVRMVMFMIQPGLNFIINSALLLILPLVSIAFLRWELLLVPGLFSVAFCFALRRYRRQLAPVMGGSRLSFGQLNAVLTETVGGITVVK